MAAKRKTKKPKSKSLSRKVASPYWMLNIAGNLDVMTIPDYKVIAASIGVKLGSGNKETLKATLIPVLEKKKTELSKRWRKQLQKVAKWKLRDLQKLIVANDCEAVLGEEQKIQMDKFDISVKQLFKLCIEVCANTRIHAFNSYFFSQLQ